MINIIILMVYTIIVLICVLLTYRVDKVYWFKCELNDLGYNICKNYLDQIEMFTEEEVFHYAELRRIWLSINKISPNKMLYSFKPLKPKYWLNEEQMKFLGLWTS